MASADLLRFRTSPFVCPAMYGVSLDGGYAIDDSADWVAAVFQVPEEEYITHVGLLIGTINGTPPTYKVSIKYAQEDGLPFIGTITSASFKPLPEWANTFQWIELLSPFYSVRGRLICVLVEYQDGLINSSNCAKFVFAWDQYYTGRIRLPYWVNNSYRGSGGAIWALRGAYQAHGCPIQSVGYYNLNNPAQKGLRFRMPKGFGATYTLKGIQFEAARLATNWGRSIDVVLYDGMDELKRITFDCDITRSYSSQSVIQVYFSSPLPLLEFGHEYVAAISPNDVDTNFHLYYYEAASILDMTAWPGSTAYYLVERATTTDMWTRARTHRPAIDLIIGEWNVAES